MVLITFYLGSDVVESLSKTEPDRVCYKEVGSDYVEFNALELIKITSKEADEVASGCSF